MVLLDLFCGAGGGAEGYRQAGFRTIVGIDVAHQGGYPFDFVRADATTFPLDGFDAVHASPPCQAFSRASRKEYRSRLPDLLTPTLARLEASGLPYVVENVDSAPMPADSLTLCGTMFGLGVFRHRRFAVNFPVPDAPRCNGRHRGRIGDGRYFIVAGKPHGHLSSGDRWVKQGDIVDWSKAMGIWWMDHREIIEAVPPAYTKFIGGHLLRHLRRLKRGRKNLPHQRGVLLPPG
jgi:hypothetical protein